MPVFGFTDIEGSTGLWEKHQDSMGPVISRHYALLEQGVARHGGIIIKTTGDGIFAIFPDESGDKPSAVLDFALDMQRRFQDEAWPVIGELRVRMAFHCGRAEEMGGDYYGPTANRTARLMSLGWGGQILVSGDLQKQARLPEGARWLDLGAHQVKDLPEPVQVFGLDHPALKLREFPPLKSLSNRPNNLPEQLFPFVGRRRELKDIASLLAAPHSRLVTLLGAGGMGKSRLALQGALENLVHFKHGAYLVRLEDLPSPDALFRRIAEALKLGLYRQKDPKEQLLDYLKDKNLLLVLDPCEGLAGGVGLISELLEACPALRMLMCSRRRLNLRGESVLEVRGLELPVQGPAAGPGDDACAAFFTQQAQGVQAGFELKPEDRPHFLRICRVLQGMPLGLELAAEWVRLVPVKVLAERLEKDPCFLSSTRQDRVPSHRSLKALFESAWLGLAGQDRATLAKLSVFQGAFTAVAAQAVLSAGPPALAALVDQCLLLAGDAGAYALADSVRGFAAIKLKESPAHRDAVLDAHARHFCGLLKGRERGLMGYGQARALAETRQDFPDIQRAWDHAVARALAHELAQAARGVGLFTDMQGLAREWEPRMDRAVRLFDGVEVRAFEGLSWEAAQAALGALLANEANYLFSLGRGAEALDKINRGLSLFRRAGDRTGAAYGLVRWAIFLGPEDERRRPALEEAAGLYQALGDANGVAWARRNLGYLLCRQGNSAAGKPMVDESLAVFRELGNLREAAWSLNSLGQLALEAGETASGAQMLREARDIFLGLGDLENAAWTLNTLGLAAIKRRHWTDARPLVEESLKLFGQIRHFRGRAQALRNLCDIHAGMGDLDKAFGAVDQIILDAQAAGDPAGQAGAMLQKGQLLARQHKLDEALVLAEEAQECFAKVGSALGQALALESQACMRMRQEKAGPARSLFQQAGQCFAQAEVRDGEARVHVRLGDLDFLEARPEGGEVSYRKALKLSRQNKPGDYSLGALLGLAALFHKQGRNMEALHLALLCERALALGLMPASEAEFYEELGRKSEAVLARLGTKLMQSVIAESRAKMAKQDARTLLRESIEK